MTRDGDSKAKPQLVSYFSMWQPAVKLKPMLFSGSASLTVVLYGVKPKRSSCEAIESVVMLQGLVYKHESLHDSFQYMVIVLILLKAHFTATTCENCIERGNPVPGCG